MTDTVTIGRGRHPRPRRLLLPSYRPSRYPTVCARLTFCSGSRPIASASIGRQYVAHVAVMADDAALVSLAEELESTVNEMGGNVQ